MGGKGPWFAVLGSSQGARIGAVILFDQQLRAELGIDRRNVWREFKFGVLLAGRGPLVSLSPGLGTPLGMAEASSSSVLSPFEERDCPSMESSLTVPTVHVHGLNGLELELHRKMLRRCCDAKSARLIQWEWEHRVPTKTNDITICCL